MQILSVTNLPIWLPGDAAFTPFGDPFSDVTVTHASPGVFTVPGYDATAGDTVIFSASPADATPGTPGALPGGITANTEYFVVSPSGDTFSVSLTKGGGAISTTSTGSGLITAHFTANDAGINNITLPFKPGNSVVVFNPSTSALVLQGAPDLSNQNLTGQPTQQPVYSGSPQGPGTYNTILTCGAAVGFYGPVVVDYDWIRVSTSATLFLLQN